MVASITSHADSVIGMETRLQERKKVNDKCKTCLRISEETGHGTHCPSAECKARLEADMAKVKPPTPVTHKERPAVKVYMTPEEMDIPPHRRE
jgi:hypothetical protein